MDEGQEHDREDAAAEATPRGKTLTRRIVGPIRYRKYEAMNNRGKPSLFFKFELAPGQSDLPQPVYDLLHELKRLDHRPGHQPGTWRTGLHFERSRTHGRVWVLRNDVSGRHVADILDARLNELARRLEAEERGPER